MTSAAARRGGSAVALALVAMGILWAPAFGTPASGWGDWQWFHHMWEAGRVGYVRWHEVPLWNPYHCGGASLWGNPQAQVYSPTYLVFAIPFGTTLGHKLFLLQHAVAGFVGMMWLARRELRASRIAAFYAAAVWCASGFFAWHGAGGHATFLAFYYAPLLLLAWRASLRDLRFCAATALVMTLVVVEGGHYPFPYFVVWLALDAVLCAIDSPRSVGRIVGAASLAGGLTALLGAFRFVPILIAMRAHPHPVPDLDSLTFDEILTMLTAREHDYRFAGHGWVWPEYGAYVGWAAVSLLVVGVGVSVARLGGARRSQALFLLSGLLLFFLLTQGSATPHHPWPLLQELPFYRSIHVPSRFRVMLLFYVALLGGVAVDALRTGLSRVPLRADLRPAALAVPLVLALAVPVDVYAVSLGIIDRWDGAPIGVRGPSAHHYLVRGRRYLEEYANYPSENVGTNECYDPVPWAISPALWLGEGPQARLVPEDAGQVVEWGRTNLTVWADVELDRPARVVFNQNFAPGWSSSDGTIVQDTGRLAVDVPRPGRVRVSARYLPADLPYTVPVSLVGVLACAAVARGSWRRRSAPARPQ